MLLRFLAILLIASASKATAAERPAAKGRGLEADPTKFHLVLSGGWRDRAGNLRIKGADASTLKFTTIEAYAVSSLGAGNLAADGSLELEASGHAPTGRPAEAGGIYLFAGMAGVAPAQPRSHLVAAGRSGAREFTTAELPPKIVIDRAVPLDLEIGDDGRLRRFGVLGTSVIAENIRDSMVWCGERPALYEK